MVNLKSIVIALSLIFTDATNLFEGDTFDSASAGATLVFLTSVAVLVSHVRLFPLVVLKKGSCIYLLLEAALSLIIFEFALRVLWKRIQDFVASNAESLIEDLSVRKSMQSVMCYICCGRKNCAKFISALCLKLFSFCFLITTLVAL